MLSTNQRYLWLTFHQYAMYAQSYTVAKQYAADEHFDSRFLKIVANKIGQN